MPDLWVVRCPVLPYEWGVHFQQVFAAARQEGRIPDLLLLLEHRPVYTRGRRTRPEELPMGEEWYRAQGIEVCDTDRGGAVTYHGPGQLVGYPIVSLKPYGDDVHEYVRKLERTVIETLGSYGIEAALIDDLTGVWVNERKIGSIGIHISRGVTTHGLAVNINNDLQPFEWIVPCGIQDVRMTSVSRELGAQQDLDGFAKELAGKYASIFERQCREIDFQDAVSKAVPTGENALSNAFAPLT
jgi:lipoate-protein ligase B